MPHISLKNIQNNNKKNDVINQNINSNIGSPLKKGNLVPNGTSGKDNPNNNNNNQNNNKDNVKHINPLQNNDKQLIDNSWLKSIIDKPNLDKPNIDKPIINKLNENERNKQECVIRLYIAEFNEKLGKYKSKKLEKLNDDELLEFKSQIQNEITQSNSLGLLTESSKKLLDIYEYIGTSAGLNIKGVANQLKHSEEYNNCVKAILLKYAGESLISNISPEAKLLFILFQSSMICHANNELLNSKKIIKNIEKDNELNNEKIKDINDKFNILDTN